jgi:hypothetical protein
MTMSTLLDSPRPRQTTGPSTGPGDRLRTTMAAARLSFTWLGVRKTLTSAQKNQAADTFGAEGKFLSAGKKLLDTSHPGLQSGDRHSGSGGGVLEDRVTPVSGTRDPADSAAVHH